MASDRTSDETSESSAGLSGSPGGAGGLLPPHVPEGLDAGGSGDRPSDGVPTDEAGTAASLWTPPSAPPGLGVSPPPPPSRRERRREQRRRRRQRRVRFLLVVVLVAAAAAGVVLATRHKPSPPRRDRAAVRPAPKMSTVLFAYQAANREAQLLILFGIAQKGSQGSALLIPPSTQVEIPSFGSGPVGSSLRRGGARLLQMSLANALGIDVGPVVVFDEAGLTSVFQPVEPLDVNLPNSQDAGGDGAGLTTSEVVNLLITTQGDSTELDHQVVAHEVFAAWLQALRKSATFENVLASLPAPAGVGADDAAARAGVIRLLRALVGSDVRFDTVPVNDIGALGSEAYQLQRDQLRQTMTRDFPGGLLGGAVRPRVEILNGVGGVGVAQAVTARLLRSGVEVVISGNANHFGYAQTVVFYDKAEDRRTAERIVAALGVGKIQRLRPVSSASVSVIVGADFKTGQ